MKKTINSKMVFAHYWEEFQTIESGNARYQYIVNKLYNSLMPYYTPYIKKSQLKYELDDSFCQDVAQRFFCLFFQSLPNYDPDISSPSGYFWCYLKQSIIEELSFRLNLSEYTIKQLDAVGEDFLSIERKTFEYVCYEEIKEVVFCDPEMIYLQAEEETALFSYLKQQLSDSEKRLLALCMKKGKRQAKKTICKELRISDSQYRKLLNSLKNKLMHVPSERSIKKDSTPYQLETIFSKNILCPKSV